MKSLFLLLSLLLASAHLILADDEVHMINGKIFRGTVVEQTDSHVSIELPLGLITLKRGEIREIKISPDSELKRQQRMMVNKFRTQINELNKASRKAYEARNLILSARQGVLATENTNRKREEKIHSMEVDQRRLKQEIESYNRYRGLAVSNRIFAAYTALLSQHEILTADIELEKKLLEGLFRKEAASGAELKVKEDQLQQTVEYLKQERQRLLDEGCPESELKLVTQTVTELSDKASRSTKVRLMQYGNSYMLPVNFNGITQETLMLDTGCSGLLLNRRIFNNLRLPPFRFKGNATSTIANGSTMEVEVWQIDKVEVNGYTVRNIEATVPVDAAHDSIIPLLGMGFLKHFNFQIDPIGKTLTLEPLTGRNH